MVCKHAFSFSPVYAENAPGRLPFQEFVAGMPMKARHVLQFVLRLICTLGSPWSHFFEGLFLTPKGTWRECCCQVGNDANGAEDVAFDELIGIQGPVFHLVENAFTMSEEDYDYYWLTLVSALMAFAYLGALKLGRWVHFYIINDWFQVVVVGIALIEMYASCLCENWLWTITQDAINSQRSKAWLVIHTRILMLSKGLHHLGWRATMASMHKTWFRLSFICR
ncbi:RING/U-box superfamily protein, partial [Thalictrum thalictroides]